MGLKPRARRPVRLRIELAPLPTVWCSDPGALSVGLQSGRDDLVRGERTASGVEWDVEIEARDGPGGELDFAGPLVHGKRGERFLYISWGEPAGDRDHQMFRRLKLYLGPLVRASWSQPGISRAMVGAGRSIAVAVSGRGPDGTPHCGTAPAHWSLS